MRVKIFDLSWNVDLNRLENEINVFLAMLPGNAVKHVQSAASSRDLATLIRCKTDYLVRFGTRRTEKTLRPRYQRGGEIQLEGAALRDSGECISEVLAADRSYKGRR
jgi:hypothetical protein